jgi:NTE family protein
MGEKNKRGLVLSGGAAHCFAQLGVLKAMQEMQMAPDILSGASAGAVIGSLYADGHQPEEILEMFKNNKLFNFVNIKLNKLGLFDISGLKKILEKNLRTKRLEDLPKPLFIVATNISKAKPVYFKEGNLLDLVIASSSIPVVFRPVKIDDDFYVDGGVTDNFPLEPLKDVCQTIVGVNVNPIVGFNPEEGGLGQLAIHIFQMSVASGLEKKKKELDFYIEPIEMHKYSYIDLGAGKEMMEIGYKEAKRVMSK